MLFYKTISPTTLELLKEIQRLPIFKNLRLVGGTSLALQIGHRISVDLDLFGEIKADRHDITTALNSIGKVKIIHFTENIFIYAINGIKVDIVNYQYPWLAEKNNTDNLNLANLSDIAAMKLAAITGRGSKKDFIDLYYLLEIFTLQQIIDFYSAKYHDGSLFLVLKSLSYFKEAEEDLMPELFDEISWETLKTSIKNQVKEYVIHNK